MPEDPSFEVRTTGTEPDGSTLLVGLSNPGMPGLTATDYLVDQLEPRQVGYVRARGFPSLVPFAEGEPRHPTRLYDVPDSDLVVLMNELFVPVGIAEAFADGLLNWAGSRFEEVVALHGVPFKHGPDEHRVFHVATPEYRERRLADQPYDPLSGGFLDGVVGELLGRSITDEAPPTGILLTPTHPPGPDVDAALLFIDALQSIYGIDVDEGELQKRSEEIKRYYAELADRVEAIESEGRERPEDRAYM